MGAFMRCDRTSKSQTPKEREQSLEFARREEYKNLPPTQIVPELAIKGQYTAIESVFSEHSLR